MRIIKSISKFFYALKLRKLKQSKKRLDKVLKKVPLDFLKKAYYGLHDLELDLAVQKVGEER